MVRSITLLGLLFCVSHADASTTMPTGQTVQLRVTEKGFEPGEVHIAAGTSVLLKVTRTTNNTCATAISIPSRKIKKDLPLSKAVSIDLGKLEKGDIRFACAMNMLSGQIIVE